jgi:ABC-type antimicrobial peptide transport system permease subunit
LIRSIVEEVEPGTRISGIAPLETLFARATAQPRFTTGLVGAFGSLALVLAAVGIYGTLSYLVTARRREIGIRLALGARPSAIMSTVLRRGVVPALGGALVGLAAAIAIARVFRALLFDVEPLDPVSIAGSAAVLALVAVTAALVPAQRASRVDPTIALRSE